ncbi:MAG: hypothetical protein LBG72_02860 [Spirochaetaceae bacterium]|nr:hypothetical protein [Spirochaetaceae bacterium]
MKHKVTYKKPFGFLKILHFRRYIARAGQSIKRALSRLSDRHKIDKLRREFSANVSHELKTPLTSIYGYAEMLEGGMVKEEDKPAFIHKIKDESARMIALVEDIMFLSSLDEGKNVKVFEKTDIAAIAAEACEKLRAKADEHKVRLSFNAGGGAMFKKGNRSMLLLLFVNLIDNAIKYNTSGGLVRVEAARRGRHIWASVSDTGIGIPKEAQKRVFERFYRVDKSRSKKTGGTGLGLAIVKHIALLHHAEISLQSHENIGTTVTMVF